MAQLPIYRQRGNISTENPGMIKGIDASFSEGYVNMQKNAQALYNLSLKWQESKDAVENLDGRNKLNSGIAAILDEAANYNEYSTPEELSNKQQELTQKMNNLVPEIVSGFSNNQKAREFESNGQFATQNNIYKLQSIFRDKYGDMYNANLLEAGDSALKSYTMTGDEAYKQEYFDAIDTGVQSGYLDREQAEKLKLSTDKWNYDYVYSQLLENPYFKASDEVMAKIDPVKQRSLRNFARAEQKKAQAEALQAATNDFFLNPTKENLNKIYKHNPKARGNKQLENMVDSSEKINYQAVTTIEGMGEALDAVKELAQIDVSTANGKKAYAQKAAEIGLAINKSQSDGQLSEKDSRKLYNMIYKDMMNDNFKNQLKNMPNLEKEWYQQYYNDSNKLRTNYLKAEQELKKLNLTPGAKDTEEYKKAEEKKNQAWKALNYYKGFIYGSNNNRAQNAPLGVSLKMEQLQRDAAANMLDAYMSGDMNKANLIKEQFGNDMTRLKYWYIPELQRKNLKAGDKFSVNGKVYSYQGFSKNDVIVEVN